MNKETKIQSNKEQSNKVQTTKAEMKTPMYEIKITALREAIVKNLNSNKEYKVKVEPYHRVNKNGERIVCRQVRIDGIPGVQARSGVIQVPRQIDKASGKQKLLVTFKSDLTGKKTSSMEFNEQFI